MRNRIIYGYEMQNGVIQINATQKEILQRIFNDYIAGESIRGITQALNAEGIPSPNGKIWTHCAVGNMLKENRYYGNDRYPAIISDGIFQQTQEKRQKTNVALGKNTKKGDEKLPYEGMIFCGECGRKYWRLHYQTRIAWACGLHLQGKRDKSGAVCGNKRWLTDTEIEKSFIRLQNRIFDGAVMIQQPQNRNTKRLETLKTKYQEMLEYVNNYEEKSLVDIIFWIAAEEYTQSRGAEDQTIQQTVKEAGRAATFREDVFRRIVRKITVTETNLCFELINGQKIQNL